MASRSRILQVTYMWHFKMVFMLPHVIVTSGVIPTYGGVHQKWRFKNQSSTPRTTLCIKRGIPFMVIDDKGGEMDKDMKLSLDMWWQRGWESMNIIKREQKWEEWNSWTKRSTQVGGASSWIWLIAFDMCIFMCLIAYCISLKIQYAYLCGVC